MANLQSSKFSYTDFRVLFKVQQLHSRSTDGGSYWPKEWRGSRRDDDRLPFFWFSTFHFFYASYITRWHNDPTSFRTWLNQLFSSPSRLLLWLLPEMFCVLLNFRAYDDRPSLCTMSDWKCWPSMPTTIATTTSCVELTLHFISFGSVVGGEGTCQKEHSDFKGGTHERNIRYSKGNIWLPKGTLAENVPTSKEENITPKGTLRLQRGTPKRNMPDQRTNIWPTSTISRMKLTSAGSQQRTKHTGRLTGRHPENRNQTVCSYTLFNKRRLQIFLSVLNLK